MSIGEIFWTQLPCQLPMNMTMVLWCRFQGCLGTFNILFVEASSETGLFRHLSDYDFGVRNFQNAKSMRVIFFKCLKVNLDFKNGAKNWQKAFNFSGNWIGIGVVKLSLWRARYFSSAANVLRSSPKILHIEKRDFFQPIFLGSYQ